MLLRYSLSIRHFLNLEMLTEILLRSTPKYIFFEKLTELTELIRRMLILYAVYKFMHDKKKVFFLNERQRKLLPPSANSEMAVVFRAVACENPVIYSLLPTFQNEIRAFIIFQFYLFCIFIIYRTVIIYK